MAQTKSIPDHRISRTVKSHTGKTTEQWHTLLNRWNWLVKDADQATHHLRRRYGLSQWWAQTIITRYHMQRRPRQ